MIAMPPGATLGVLGGGQLGRMLALAAARLGLDVHVFDPEPRSAAARVAARETCAPFADADAVAGFARACAVVTYEFENVPAEAAAITAAAGLLRPGAKALAIAQDRIDEKAFARACGAETTPHAAIETRADLDAALARLGVPAVLKTRRLGYDGKGQVWLRAPEDADAAWAALGGASGILEAAVPIARELSLIGARAADGATAFYDLCENRHEAGILRQTRAPAPAADAFAARARAIASAMLERLDYVGVLAVELFETKDGRLLVNEIAPRVHNSGHWTIEGAATSQFEQHVRAVMGWPLGDPTALGAALMTNLIGPDADRWAAFAAEPGAHLHLYAKGEARPGRKMGHVTRIARAQGER